AVSVYIHGASGQTLATGTVSAASGQATRTVTTSSFTAASVALVVVKVNGWVFPVTWTAPPTAPATCVPVNAGGNVPHGQTCTVTSVTNNQWTSEGYQWANVYFNVSSPQTNAAITLNLASILGWTPTSVLTNTDFRAQTVPGPTYACSELPILRLNRNTGASSWSGFLQVTTKPGAYSWNTGPDLICS
ncbi:MAG: hypothetical protein ACK5IM_10645, partial [Demequina sp.]|uniref:hypothetical protein n=1 Tax=Demequina sp. TaxID=2050685 RepID=UPI003A8A641B